MTVLASLHRLEKKKKPLKEKQRKTELNPGESERADLGPEESEEVEEAEPQLSSERNVRGLGHRVVKIAFRRKEKTYFPLLVF